jgi:hypothetical protein
MKATHLISGIAPKGDRPFYGAECPSYPSCEGGCGLGCTKEIESSGGVAQEPVAWRYRFGAIGAWYLSQTDTNLNEQRKSEVPDLEYQALYAAPQPASVAQAGTDTYRETVRQVAAAREERLKRLSTALLRIQSLDEKNVPKYAQQIASEALALSSTPRKAPASCTHCIDETDCSNVDICSALSTVPSPPAEINAWPVGCHSPNSCHRNGRCMYVGCKHDGKDIATLAALAISSTDKSGAA